MAQELATPGVKFSFDTGDANAEIQEFLRRFLPKEKVIAVALAGGEVIADTWRMLELPHNKTGEYQETIAVHIIDAGPDYCEISVGTTAPQARFLEWGTSKQSAQPVMRPAYDQAKGPAQAAMQAEMIKDNIETPAQKAAAASSRRFADTSPAQMASVDFFAAEVARRQKERGPQP